MHDTMLKRKSNALTDISSAKTPRLSEFLSGSSLVVQSKVDELIVKFIVQDMQPLSIVEGDGFRNLLSYVNPRVKVMCKETLNVKLTDTFVSSIEKLKAHLSTVQFVCTTADAWTQQARSYMGVTCHWIDPHTLTRQSAVLAFRRFRGTHSFDKIGNLLMSIHIQFNLETSKITHVVTDNGSNFIKAFKSFSINEDDEEDDYQPASVNDILTNGHDEDESGNAIYLPPHTSCVAHSLNLLGSVDAEKSLVGNQQFKKLYRSVSAKCVALSNAVHTSSKNAETSLDVIGKAIPKPNCTRWNSTYDSFCSIYDVRDKINVLLERLKLPKFVDLELEFLGEWLHVMSPIAIALDKMQGENTIDSYYGAVLPALLAIKKRLDAFAPKHTEPLISVLQSGLMKRFGDILSLDNIQIITSKQKALIIATTSHPFFKLRWCPNEEMKPFVQDLFLQEVVRVNRVSQLNESTSLDASSSAQSDDEFYGFTPVVHQSDYHLSAAQYLQDSSHDFQQLKLYPAVARVFIKFNTTIPSSAPVERLFSAAGQILVPRRNRLSDDMFEKLLVLNKNNSFC